MPQLPPVITLFEAYGSGASEIGPMLADALGVPWVGQQVSTAEMEAADPKGTGRINVNQFIVSTALTDVGSTGLIESPIEGIVRRQALTVRELATHGGVILGRNATIILADRPNTLHVKLDAPVADRVAHGVRVEGVPAAQADLRRRREDAARAELSLESWHWDPRLTAHFDFVVNTSAFAPDDVVAMALDALRRKAG